MQEESAGPAGDSGPIEGRARTPQKGQGLIMDYKYENAREKIGFSDFSLVGVPAAAKTGGPGRPLGRFVSRPVAARMGLRQPGDSAWRSRGQLRRGVCTVCTEYCTETARRSGRLLRPGSDVRFHLAPAVELDDGREELPAEPAPGRAQQERADEGVEGRLDHVFGPRRCRPIRITLANRPTNSPCLRPLVVETPAKAPPAITARALISQVMMRSCSSCAVPS